MLNYLTAKALRAILLAAEKTVIIDITEKDLEFLKNNHYNLCFAKKVGEEQFNVVWQAYKEYLCHNEFSWTPQYELFGSNKFKDNITVSVATNKVKIGFHEQSTLNSAGNLSQATTGGLETSFTLVNNYGSIHPGVNQISTGINGETISTPIYVSVDAVGKGNTFLTPVEKVLVWFEQHIETSTMFSESKTREIEIDLTDVNSATRLYQDQEWQKS